MITCAKPGSPPGGDKDETPPKPIKAKPSNYSTNYDRNKIVIKFDEFITLKNQFTEFTISPPLEEKPTPLLRGKSIHINLPAKDLDSLTYTLDFGQSIADNNEGNKLPNFQFVVSKNNHIDSFSVKGQVVDAFTHEPEEEQIFVFLNRNLADSVPLTTIPSYLGRSNPEGEFAINHIAPGTYNIFALKDANNNMLYDLPSEIIAFLDKPIHLHPDSFPKEPPVLDTINNDILLSDSASLSTHTSVGFISDSLLNDTTNLSDSTNADSIAFNTYGYTFNLYSFLEKPPFNQFLVDYNRDKPEKLTIFFNENQDTLPSVRLLYPDTTGKWYYPENNPTLDTLAYWLADSNLVNKDSIVVEIIHPLTDTNKNTLPYTDTLLFRYKKKKEGDKKPKSRSRGLLRKNQDEKSDSTAPVVYRLPINILTKGSAHDLNVPIIIEAEAPVVYYNTDEIKLYKLIDTLEIPANYQFHKDSLQPRRFKLSVDYEPITNYKLVLNEGALRDIYYRTIDTTITNFTTQRDDYYGIVNLEVTNVTCPMIIQLFDKDKKMVKEDFIYQNDKIIFDYLPPGKYSVKIIYDCNNNKKWDTGNLKEKIQPEKVDFYSTILEVRSNWEVEYNWELSK
jgi:hypothetical protein